MEGVGGVGLDIFLALWQRVKATQSQRQWTWRSFPVIKLVDVRKWVRISVVFFLLHESWMTAAEIRLACYIYIFFSIVTVCVRVRVCYIVMKKLKFVPLSPMSLPPLSSAACNYYNHCA